MPLPPMTNLVDFSLASEDANNAYKIPSSADFRVMTAQLCWMLSLNRHLTHLHVGKIHSTGFKDSNVFAEPFCSPSVKRLSILPFREDENNLPQIETGFERQDGNDDELPTVPSWKSKIVGHAGEFDVGSTLARRASRLHRSDTLMRKPWRMTIYPSGSWAHCRSSSSKNLSTINAFLTRKACRTIFNCSNDTLSHYEDLNQSERLTSRIRVAFILKKCYGLEELVISYGQRSHYVDLEDFINQEP
ncbi:hypothetical protein BG015_005354 [Linnemannia schmuckeri]|uniref:Uncharacterized protein n=1 Tax=Linnemannia schmuckeri TaxID=64567 RepID=A0A9P5R857_9FUNG|nr:hypothetical protein BG015_005354 [Linnemannia schmuckeri]